MKPYVVALVLLLVPVAPAATQPATPVLLRPDRVFDGEQVHAGWVVLVRGERIEAAGPAASWPWPATRLRILRPCGPCGSS